MICIEIEITFDGIHDLKERKTSAEDLSETTARERIEKYVYQSILNNDNETLALQRLSEALNVGAEVGFNDFFVRQKNLYSILVKAAVAKPTAFREFDMPNGNVDVIVSHENVDFVEPYNLYNLKSFSKTLCLKNYRPIALC